MAMPAPSPSRSPAPAAGASVELRAGNAGGGQMGAFPRALQRTVHEPVPARVKSARVAAAEPARRKGQADAAMGASGAAGHDADELLTELNARHALRTKIVADDLSRTPPEYGLKPPPAARQPLMPATGGIVLPPSDRDPSVPALPCHDQPGAPMPGDAAAGAEAPPAARRSAPPFTTAPLHGLPATPPAARIKPPLNGPPPAVPRPHSSADKGAPQLLPAPGNVVAPPAEDQGVLSTPTIHDQPGAPMPRDSGAEAGPAMGLAGPVETRAPDLGAGLTAHTSVMAEAPSAASHRNAIEAGAGQHAAGPPGVAVAPAAANTAAQPASWPGPGLATVAAMVAPAVPAAKEDSVRPANEAGSTPFALSLPMGLAPASPGLATAAATATPAEARLPAAPGSADFSSQLGAQLTTFVREGVQHARLHLHPVELGPVTVRIQIDGQAAQVHLAAEHALTRQALEQSMPMLAGSLREAGLTLSGGGVFEQPRQRDGGDAPGQPGGGPGNAPGSERGPETPRRTATGVPARRGVVDLVA
jgi:flagellar hook-length control protein FliK